MEDLNFHGPPIATDLVLQNTKGDIFVLKDRVEIIVKIKVKTAKGAIVFNEGCSCDMKMQLPAKPINRGG